MRIETLLHTLTDCDRAYTSVLPQGFFNDDMHSLIFYVLFIKNGFGIIRLSSSGLAGLQACKRKIGAMIAMTCSPAAALS